MLMLTTHTHREEAAEVGVSFRTPDGQFSCPAPRMVSLSLLSLTDTSSLLSGKFPEPNVIQPIDDEEDEGEAELEG